NEMNESSAVDATRICGGAELEGETVEGELAASEAITYPNQPANYTLARPIKIVAGASPWLVPQTTDLRRVSDCLFLRGRRLVLARALLARTHAAEVFKAVNSRRVAVAEIDLDRVLAHRLRLPRRRLRLEHRQRGSHARQRSGRRSVNRGVRLL